MLFCFLILDADHDLLDILFAASNEGSPLLASLDLDVKHALLAVGRDPTCLLNQKSDRNDFIDQLKARRMRH